MTQDKKRIIPEREKCDCGKKVLNHHWLCDECWSKKYGNKFRKKEDKRRRKTGRETIINPIPKELKKKIKNWNKLVKK